MSNHFDVLVTGAPDGVDDFIYTLKSYSGTHYSGLTSHLNFQLPRQPNEIKALTDRPNGKIILRHNENELFSSTLVNVNFHQGSQNSTFSISSAYTLLEDTSEELELPIEIVTNDYDGKRRFKTAGFHIFMPLDFLIFKAELVQIDQVIINISAEKQYLILREA